MIVRSSSSPEMPSHGPPPWLGLMWAASMVDSLARGGGSLRCSDGMGEAAARAGSCLGAAFVARQQNAGISLRFPTRHWVPSIGDAEASGMDVNQEEEDVSRIGRCHFCRACLASRGEKEKSSSGRADGGNAGKIVKGGMMRLRGGRVTFRERKRKTDPSTPMSLSSDSAADTPAEMKNLRGPMADRGSAVRMNDFGADDGGKEGDASSDLQKVRAEIELMKARKWPREPPKVISREYTLEDDLALISRVDEELRRVCDAGDKSKAKELLEKGAVINEWDNCTDLCVETLCEAQWEVWEERKTGEPADLDKIVAEKQKERDLYIDAGFDPSESDSPIEYFLSCQMTGELKRDMLGEENSKWIKQYTKDALESVREDTRKDFPLLQEKKSEVDFATFRSGDDEKSGDSHPSEEFEATISHGYVPPFGKKVMKVELALKRNASHELDSEELEVASWMHPPCNALQDLMSESVSEAEGVLLRIPKIATEITQAELDPWDNANDMRLSDTFGQKSFDFVDSLAGFERAGNMLGLRGSDQNYGMVRSRFLKSQQGSYKRPGSGPLTTRKAGKK